MTSRKSNFLQTLPGRLGAGLGLAFLLLLVSGPVLAESGPQAYVIGPEDVLTVNIFAGGTNQETIELSVSSQGTVDFPFLGKVKASGLTISQLTDAVTKDLARDYFVDPQVQIRIKEHKSQKVYITGAVKNPGLYALEGGTTLLELLAKAGGVTAERGHYAVLLKGSISEVQQDATKVKELAADKRGIKVDLRELLDQGLTESNVTLQAGDVVYIQPSTFAAASQYKLYVLGKVNRPGAFEYQEGLTALDVVVLAGGFAKYAAPNRTVITRRKDDGSAETIKIDLNRVREGKEKDIMVKPGDRIYVPKSWF